ncbi:Rid family detoxifying hydrolase [Aureibacter tunicatorum]|uniref:2-iminobutanoate/2-iminopropanoate deaminase n=1 Tax=Aureibacter tunicatorum TaxID=866807 RepID=A0AAE3XKV9_9BACT|nr:Rid family detoxifying hydrolase [Aureibacter tunicatorum]MDR6237795.1 2-iminobutanoate/2-iminopropanoate deaminase [Aureibacter tunicatorum]BDD02830.1 reactive intermediate/imine deaminase [Aureibacter tunicatorum]
MAKEIIQTPNAPAPIGPYNQATKVGNTVYGSGQIAIDPAKGDLADCVGKDIKAETKQVMDNMSEVLKAAGATFEDIVKCTIFVSDMGNFVAINEVYGQYFNEETAPARETVEVAGLPKGVNVEISFTAVIG